MLPLNPISQASVFSGCPVPYSAVPVLPNVPAGRPCPAAVPDATTCAIIWCRSLTTAGGSRWVAAVSSGAPTTRRGARTVPVSTAAATIAMFSGEASTRPCPIDVAARSAWSDGVGTDPAYAANPICGALPSPNSAAVDGKSGGVRCAVASPMKAVLHDSANASSRSLTCPSPSALWNTSPPAVEGPVELTGVGVGRGQHPAGLRVDGDQRGGLLLTGQGRLRRPLHVRVDR